MRTSTTPSLGDSTRWSNSRLRTPPTAGRSGNGRCRPSVPRADDVELDELARRFDLCGGNIRNIALAAAYFAAEDGRPVAMRDLMRGVAREFLKLGRLVHTSDFAPYEAVLL